MAAAAAQPGAGGAPAEAAALSFVKLAKLGAAITLGLVLLAIPAALVAVELFGWGRGLGYTEEDMGDEPFAVGGVGASPPPSCGESMAEPSCGEPL